MERSGGSSCLRKRQDNGEMNGIRLYRASPRTPWPGRRVITRGPTHTVASSLRVRPTPSPRTPWMGRRVITQGPTYTVTSNSLGGPSRHYSGSDLHRHLELPGWAVASSLVVRPTPSRSNLGRILLSRYLCLKNSMAWSGRCTECSTSRMY